MRDPTIRAIGLRQGGVIALACACSVALLPQCTVSAQHQWSGSGGPSLFMASLGYDPVRDTILAFGTASGDPYTYEIVPSPSGSGWRVVSNMAPNLWTNMLAYSSLRQRFVCQGEGGVPRQDGTWEWDGITWTVTPGAGPSLEHLIGHAGRGTAMGFGGFLVAGDSQIDLFEWSGTSWVLLPAPVRPSRYLSRSPHLRQYYFSSAYDPRRDKLVLFGTGILDFNTVRYGSITPTAWEWDQTGGWTGRTVSLPGSVYLPDVKMYFDSHRGSMILIGNDTVTRVFEWDGGNAWQEILVPAIYPETLAGSNTVTFDERRGVGYVNFSINSWPYGWEVATLLNSHPAEVVDHGAGCPNANRLELRHPWTRAWMGRALELQATELPSHSTAIFTAGWSDTRAGTTTLPVALDPIGMPGCFARTSLDSIWVVTGQNGTATLTLPVPLNPALIDCRSYHQAFVPDPGFNALGLAATNSLRITIGHL